MARKILDLFGRLAIVFAVIAAGWVFTVAQQDRWAVALLVLPSAAGVLVVGAILVGFARAIELLERIERNTAGQRPPGSY